MARKINFSIQWQITSLCVNRCKHCYMFDKEYDRLKVQELEFSDWILILKNIERFEKKFGVEIKNYAITGGDPFSHPDCKRLLEYLYIHHKKISILGIPERILDGSTDILEHHDVFMYQMSLDGLETTHDEIRGQGSFQRTLNALRICYDKGITTSIMFTLSKNNVKELFPLIKYLKEARISTIFSFDFLVLEGNSTGAEHLLLSNQEARAIIEQYDIYFNLSKKENWSVHLFEKPKIFNAYHHRLDNDISKSLEKFSASTRCSVGFSSLAILPNGDIYPCRRLPIKIGNLLTDSLEYVLLEHPIWEILRKRNKNSYCGGCKYYKVCGGCFALSYSITQNVSTPYPYCFLRTPDNQDNLQEYSGIEAILNTYNNQLINIANLDAAQLKTIINSNPDLFTNFYQSRL